jgi:2-methylisocitrate lyase-like PEP mutase family enzyme
VGADLSTGLDASVIISVMDLRALLSPGTVTHVPGVYDPLTAALAVRAGSRAVHFPATAVSALALGRAGGGVAHSTQIADRVATIVPVLGGVPLLADAGDGFANARDAVWTGMAYVRAGISGVVLPDTGTATIAALAEQVPELVIIARVDGFAADRGAAFAKAGADVILPTGAGGRDGLARLHEAVPDVPIVLERSEATAGTAILGDAELAELGVGLVLHPLTPLLAALRAASLVYRGLAAGGIEGGTVSGPARGEKGKEWDEGGEKSEDGGDGEDGQATGAGADSIDRLPWAIFSGLLESDEVDGRFVPAGLDT